MLRSIHTHLPWLLTASLLVACGDDKGIGGDETAGSETATTTDTGDEIGESSSTTTSSDTSTTTSNDTSTTNGDTTSTTDGSCAIGSEGCECTQGGACDPGLECLGGICTTPDATATDTTTDTTGANTACAMDVSFEILAVDATEANGWDPVMSMLGEGMIMAWDQQNDAASIAWDIDVPCDDTWHVWVRGVDQGQADSYFATVDGEPNPAAIFELDCTNAPNQATYVWKELNYRDQADPGCTYLLDPWTQDWLTGIHSFALTYRESGAVSKLWITNTDLTPP